MRAGRELRRIVIARIEDQVAALRGKVFDRATGTTPYPYAALGPSDWRDDSTDCGSSRRWALQVDIWHNQSSKGALEDLTDDVAAALKGFASEQVAMHPIDLFQVRVMDDPSGSFHGVVQIQTDIEEG